MHLSLFSLSLLTLPLLSTAQTQTHTLAYEPLLPTATPVPFAILTSTSAPQDDQTPSDTSSPLQKRSSSPVFKLESYTVPRGKDDTPLLRVGVLDPKGKIAGSSTVARKEALQNPEGHVVRISLRGDGGVLGAAVLERAKGLEEAAEEVDGGKDTGKADGLPELLVVPQAPEPKPVLNKPVVLNEQGKVAPPEQEKTLFQKYWWVGAAILLMSLAGGGGE